MDRGIGLGLGLATRLVLGVGVREFGMFFRIEAYDVRVAVRVAGGTSVEHELYLIRVSFENVPDQSLLPAWLTHCR